MFCPQCGKSNNAPASFCAGCGHQLGQAPQADARVQPGPASGAVDGQQALYRAAIGDANQGYYLERFRRFDGAGKAGPSWHWPALFITVYWLLYRKMWLAAAAYFVLVWVLMFVLQIVGGMVGGAVGMLAGYMLHIAVVMLLPALFANALYYRHCRKQIAATDALAADPEARSQALARSGGTSIVAAIVAAVLGVFLGVFITAMLAAIALPAYQDYVVRSQVAEAEAVGRAATVAVEAFHYQNQRLPLTPEEAGLPSADLSPSIRSIEIDGASGTVVITLEVASLEGKSLLLVPALEADGPITWSCTSEDIENRYLSERCRQRQ